MVCLTLDPNAPLPLPQAGQPDSYPHTRLLLTQALRYAKEYASSYFYPILNQVALRLMCHSELEPKPGHPINHLVDKYLSQPLVIELRDLEQDKNNISGAVAREDLIPGRPCILIQLADALEHSSSHPTAKEEYRLLNVGNQDPVMALKTFLLVAFFHELVHALVHAAYPIHYTPAGIRRYNVRLPNPVSETDTNGSGEVGFREELILGGMISFVVNAEDQLNFKKATRVCFGNQEGQHFQLDDGFLSHFVECIETGKYLPAFPASQRRVEVQIGPSDVCQRSGIRQQVGPDSHEDKVKEGGIGSGLFLSESERCVKIGRCWDTKAFV
ncbi:hypothetical protein VKT23_005990 [Stygiomarasmius scandens]|uniref:Uncharacterized protein n=1 Tax=Marasmiellus scandens TaxID=2682957 RepID=A0ABR1JRT7_9AGAR